MTRASRIIATWTTSLALALVALSSIDAYGQESANNEVRPSNDPLTAVCFAKPITRIFVPMTGGRFEVVVPRQKFAFVQFPETVTLQKGEFIHGRFSIHQDKNTLTIAQDPSFERGESINMTIKAGPLRVIAELKVSDEPKQAASILAVIPLPTEDFELHKANYLAKLETQRREHDASTMRGYRKSMARRLLEMKVLRPSGPRIAALTESAPANYAPDGEVRAVLTRLLQIDGDRYLEMVIDNRTNHKIQVENSWLSQGDDDGFAVDVEFDDKARTVDGSPTVIPAGTKVHSMVVVPHSVTSGLDAMRVQLRAPPGLTSLMAQQVVELWPQMPEHIARKRRWAKQLALSVRMLGGGFWTGDGQDTPGAAAGTSLTGLGVRFTKGFFHNVAFEAEVLGGRTGEAQFRDASWQGMDGEINRQAAFGRIQAFGVLRLGNRYVVSTRVGLGVQGTSYDSSFTTGGGATMDGPGDAFEIGGVWSVGGSFDARIGERWAFGAGATFSDAFNTGSRSLEASVQLGYRWTQ